MRTAGLAATVLGACGSVALTLYVGRHSPPVLVPVFVLWVLSPFVALAFAGVYSTRWSARVRAVLYWTMLIVAAGSLAIYATRAFGPPRPQGAFAFVVVPAASWVIAGAVFASGTFTRRKPGGQS